MIEAKNLKFSFFHFLMFRMVNTYIGIFLCFVKFGSPILSYKQDKEFEIF